MMFLNQTGRPAVAVLRTAVLAALLPLAGCTDSTTGSTHGSGDKRDDPALKAAMQKSKETLKPQTQSLKGNPAARRGH